MALEVGNKPPVTVKPVVAPTTGTTTGTTPQATEDTEKTQETVTKSVFGRGITWVYQIAVRLKGKGKGSSHMFLAPIDNNYKQLLDNIIQAVGTENFYKVFMKEIVRPACLDAEKDAENEFGDYNQEQWLEKVFVWFLPGAQQAHDGVKIIREKLKNVMMELKPLIALSAKKETRDKMTPDQLNRLAMLTAEFGELCEKEENKSRKGVKSGTAVAATGQVAVEAQAA